MIGSEKFVVTRPNIYLLSSGVCTDKVPTAQPPTGGCYIRVEGTGTIGTAVITGTVGGASTVETISTFDSDLVGFGLNKFTTISKVTITGFSLLTLYPASESGEKIKLSSSTTFNILADSYDKFLSETSGVYQEAQGQKFKNYKTLMYDGRFVLQRGDLITIDGLQMEVFDVSSQHGLYAALLGASRSS